MLYFINKKIVIISRYKVRLIIFYRLGLGVFIIKKYNVGRLWCEYEKENCCKK